MDRITAKNIENQMDGMEAFCKNVEMQGSAQILNNMCSEFRELLEDSVKGANITLQHANKIEFLADELRIHDNYDLREKLIEARSALYNALDILEEYYGKTGEV